MITSPRLTSFTEKYFAVWGIVLPITSLLIVPSIQGTTPSYCLAFLSIPLLLLVGRSDALPFVSGVLGSLAAVAFLILLSQLAIALVGVPSLMPLVLTHAEDTAVLLRSTLFTQSLYLVSVFAMFFFARYFYRPSWDRYILIGAVAIAVYGLYELAFYSLTGHAGDFVSNRTFGEGTASGSLFETFAIGGITTERLKSLTGEPSMYALTISPYWIYSLKTGHKRVACLLFATLVLTTSTTAFLAMVVYVTSNAYYKKSFKPLVIAASFVGLASAVAWTYVSGWIQIMIVQKLTLENDSGVDRYANFLSSVTFWWRSSWLTKLFGIGFGTVRSTDLFSTMLVNTGIVGLVLASAILLYPLWKLGSTEYEIGLKQICLVCFFVLMISVSEFSYLPTWLFLGIAYKYSLEGRRSAVPPRHPVPAFPC